MRDLFTSPTLSQSEYQKVDVSLHQRANSTLSSGVDILLLHAHHDGFE